jgi:hypothetical protein
LNGLATSACAEAMLTMRPPALLLHRRQRRARGVEGGGEIDGDDRVPLVDRELVDRRDMLDAGVVDQHVDRAEAVDRLAHHLGDRLGLQHVGAVVGHRDLVLRRQPRAQRLDLAGIAEAVQYDVRAFGSEARRDSEADAGRRSGHQRGFTFEHGGA